MSGIVLNVKKTIASGTPHMEVRKIGDSTTILITIILYMYFSVKKIKTKEIDK